MRLLPLLLFCFAVWADESKEKTKLPGGRSDLERGEKLYQGHCALCHGTGGDGRRSAYVRAAITDPEADVPRSFLQVRAVAKSGRTITGERLNEDSFSIQIRDYSGSLHSFLKQDLAEIHRDRGKSPMPSYKDKFTGTELDDLIAYLVSLREAK